MEKKNTEEKERKETQKRFRERQAEVKNTQKDLQTLNNALVELSVHLGTQKAGYDFQDWFYDFLDFFEIINRRPYKQAGRQIDGSLTISDTTYLVELKFTKKQAAVTDIDSIFKKVSTVADNTMGIMVSISGYSQVAIEGASGPKTPLLLLDHSHIYLALGGIMTFSDIIDRVRRYASQTGVSYLNVSDFGE